ncbi:chemotaxis protein CheB [Pyxidicoccus sp. 3LG]
MPSASTVPRLWTQPEPAFDFVVVAASHGGVEALRALVSALPLDFPIPIAVVLHLGARPSALVSILQWRTRLTVRWAEEGLRPRPRTLYVAPPDRHLALGERRTFVLSEGPKWHSHPPRRRTPSSSPPARVYGRRLPGRGDGRAVGKDGTAGARALREAGGTVLAQDRATSTAFGMPGAVIAGGHAHFVLPLATLAPALVSLVMVPGGAGLFGVPRQVA